MENEDRARYEWLALRCQAGDPGAFEDLVAVTACVMKGATRLDTTHGHLMAFVVLLLLISGAVEVLKHAVNRSRVEMLKEIKQVQLQVLELQASMEKNGNAPRL